MYFSDEELACTCCGTLVFDDKFRDKLNQIREQFGPMIISSGFRCPNHPLEVAKSRPGEHTTGQAVDVAVSHDRAHELLRIAFEEGIPRIGVQQKGNGRFIHLGVSPNYPGPTVWSY